MGQCSGEPPLRRSYTRCRRRSDPGRPPSSTSYGLYRSIILAYPRNDWRPFPTRPVHLPRHLPSRTAMPTKPPPRPPFSTAWPPTPPHSRDCWPIYPTPSITPGSWENPPKAADTKVRAAEGTCHLCRSAPAMGSPMDVGDWPRAIPIAAESDGGRTIARCHGSLPERSTRPAGLAALPLARQGPIPVRADAVGTRSTCAPLERTWVVGISRQLSSGWWSQRWTVSPSLRGLSAGPLMWAGTMRSSCSHE